MIQQLKAFRRILLRKLKLRPIDSVFGRLRKGGYPDFKLGLEVFGFTGEYHTMNYFSLVNQLHVWEISSDCEQKLKSNLPGAVIKITDSFQEIKTTTYKYDLIVLDNHQGKFGKNYCEHFDILEYVFPILSSKAVLIFNIIPSLEILKGLYPELYEEHKKLRQQFYQTEQVDRMELSFLKEFYSGFFGQHGFKVDFLFTKQRNKIVHYFVAALSSKQSQ